MSDSQGAPVASPPPTHEAIGFAAIGLPFIVAAAVLPATAGAMLFAALILLSLTSTSFRLAQIITLQFVLMNLNPVIFSATSTGGLHLVLPFIVLGKLATIPRKTIPTGSQMIVRWLLALGAFLIAHSLLFSTFPVVSTLKATLFISYSSAAVLTANAAYQEDPAKLIRWYTAVVTFVIACSAPLLFSSLGTTRNASGFNAILNHPNMLAVFLCIPLSFFTISLLTTNRISWPFISLLVIGLFELYRTESRGGALSFVFGCSVWWSFNFLTRTSAPKRAASRGFMLAIVAIPFALLVSENLQQKIGYFLSKSGRSENTGIIDSFKGSRGGAIEHHLNLLSQRPMTGHGFQVVSASWRDGLTVKYDPYFDFFPISASVENGFFYSSVGAELGIPGIIASYSFIGLLVATSFRNRSLPASVLIYTVLLSNVSESVLFSTSGAGSWEWQMIAISLAISNAPVSIHRIINTTHETRGTPATPSYAQ